MLVMQTQKTIVLFLGNIINFSSAVLIFGYRSVAALPMMQQLGWPLFVISQSIR